jgi:hypothetical protein
MQNPLAVTIAKNTTNAQTTLLADSKQNLRVHVQAECLQSLLNITSATVVKTGFGKVGKISVTVAGSVAGTVSDVATTGGVAAANLIGVIPNTVGIYTFNFPALVGIVIVPGTGQTVSVSFD